MIEERMKRCRDIAFHGLTNRGVELTKLTPENTVLLLESVACIVDGVMEHERQEAGRLHEQDLDKRLLREVQYRIDAALRPPVLGERNACCVGWNGFNLVAEWSEDRKLYVDLMLVKPAVRKVPLAADIIDGLAPKVRDLVVWLNEHGFPTTDSGDGSNHEAGMTCACEVPMVAVVTPSHELRPEAERLWRLLADRGVDFHGADEESVKAGTAPTIQASYDPTTGEALIVLLNVTSDMVEGIPS